MFILAYSLFVLPISITATRAFAAPLKTLELAETGR
jgi:hypothetical protein